jgi:hypothetical protein
MASRHAIGMPLGHPERVIGSDRASRRGDFPQWTRELAGDGGASGVIEDVRREEEWRG